MRLQLRRITSGGTWIPQIDGLRFVAILSVVLLHITDQLVLRSGRIIQVQPRYFTFHYFLENCHRGVQLFFVISGYIIGRPFLRQYRMNGKPVALGAYFRRRLTRLEPPYILSLLIYTTAFAFREPLKALLPHLAMSVLYLHNLTYRQMSTINFVAWSLEIEVQFYILSPLLGLIYRISGTGARRAFLCLLILAGGAFSLHHHGVIQLTILGQFHYFITGFLLADVLEGHQTQGHRSYIWDMVSLIGWPLIFLLPGVDATLAWLPILIFPVYLAAFYGPASNWFFRRSFVALTGGMCYSLYLMHMLIISAFFVVTKHFAVFSDFLLNWATQVISLGLLIAVCGTAYFVLVERPCMDPKWPQKAWHRVTRAVLKPTSV